MLEVKILRNGRDHYSLYSEYDKELVHNIKQLPKKEYEASTKSWRLGVLPLYNLITLYKGRKDIFFKFDSETDKNLFIEKYNKLKQKEDHKNNVIKNLETVREEAVLMRNELLKADFINFDYGKFLTEGTKPFNYQIVGAKFGSMLRKCLFAMEMGSGKTLTSLLTCEMNDEIKKVLIICPNSLKYNWANEIKKFTKSGYYIINPGHKSDNIYDINESKYFIVNYEYFSRNFDYNKKIASLGLDNIDALICDESHKLKNTKAQQTKNVLKCFKNSVEFVYMLTGTPIPNRIEEFYVQLNIISPLQFPNKKHFYEYFCGMVYNKHIAQYVYANQAKSFELNKEIDKFMFRVKTRDVIKDLPELQINKIILEMSPNQRNIYQMIEKEFESVNWDELNIEKPNVLSPITILTKLRQLSSEFKLDTIKEFITTLNDEGHKTITFDYYKSPLYKLNKELDLSSKVFSGDIKSDERQQLVDEFQTPNSNLLNLLITMQSGNFGINLTEASKIIVLNQSYVPAENDQAYARALRIGQKNNVSVYIFILKDSIDEHVDKIINEKRKSITETVDNQNYLDKSIVTDLVSTYKKIYVK